MGLFFTIYYVGIVIGPVAAGWIAERTGGAEAAFLFGASLAAAALLAWLVFVAIVLRRTQRP
jgi:MFS family permease